MVHTAFADSEHYQSLYIEINKAGDCSEISSYRRFTYWKGTA